MDRGRTASMSRTFSQAMSLPQHLCLDKHLQKAFRLFSITHISKRDGGASSATGLHSPLQADLVTALSTTERLNALQHNRHFRSECM